MEEYKIQPENTYNMDEKGFLIGVLQKTKRVWSKSTEIRGASQDGNREWITIVATICMDESFLPPVRIMQSKSCRYGDERTLIVRSHMGERAVYYIGACTSRAYKPR